MTFTSQLQKEVQENDRTSYLSSFYNFSLVFTVIDPYIIFRILVFLIQSSLRINKLPSRSFGRLKYNTRQTPIDKCFVLKLIVAIEVGIRRIRLHFETYAILISGGSCGTCLNLVWRDRFGKMAMLEDDCCCYCWWCSVLSSKPFGL